MDTPLTLILTALLMLLVPADASDIPADLQPWTSWVLDRHPDLPCARVGAEERACVWPGEFALSADADGGSFRLSVQVDRAEEVAVALPGGEGAWPTGVLANGRPAVVVDRSGVPHVLLGAGDWAVTGRYEWPTLPQGIAVPALIARVSLSVDGAVVPWPRIDAGGTMRLGAGDVRRPDENRLDIDVSRRVADGVPVGVTTRVSVRAAGSGREVNLGAVLVPGMVPVSLEADLPARFTSERELVIQVRPGTWALTFHALHEGPVDALEAPAPGDVWPEVETWAVATDDRVRAVNVAGDRPVDPARTTLPTEWRGLPSFLLSAGDALRFEELRRGEPAPAPNNLTLNRTLWLDLDGQGLTIQDRWTGTMSQGWRLDMRGPSALGHVRDHATDQVITAGEGGAGVELRDASVDLTADSRLDVRPATLPAVGWEADVHALSATLHLPPGWTLWAATGVDQVDGARLDAWTLLDLFFVLLVSVAAARLYGPGWGAVALVGLAMSRLEAGAPAASWVAVIALAALVRALPEGQPRRFARAGRAAAVVILALVLLPFAASSAKRALFPSLERPWTSASAMDDIPDRFVQMSNAEVGGGLATDELDVYDEWEQGEAEGTGLKVAGPLARGRGGMLGSDGSSWDRRAAKKGGKGGYLSLQQDPTAVVQTGPGLPSWSWSQATLRWSGPVTADADMRLWLMGPTGNLLFGLAQLGLLLALAWRMAELRRPRIPAGLAPLLAIGLLFGGSAHAAMPTGDLLRELETRLTAEPACGASCATVGRAELSIQGGVLRYAAEVHAEAATSWPVPGPSATWIPARVTVDGAPTIAMSRRADGFLHVRLSAGVHDVVATGPLPPGDGLTLQLGLAPRGLGVSADGWTVDGVRANGAVDQALQLTRLAGGGDDEGATSSENLAPWVEVRRTLDLGLPWRVQTEVTRVGPSEGPLALKIPLLPGEAVTDEGFEVTDGVVQAALNRGETGVSWVSTLETRASLTLTAPSGVPWSEVWTVMCSPIFACETSGPAPLRHVQDGRWSPEWRPWPGEAVTLTVARPESVPGQTVTVDRATLHWRPGKRLSEGTLTLSVRTSQGGQQLITLPEGAALQSVRVGDEDRPIQAQGREVPLPLQPGANLLSITWQQPEEAGLWQRTPAVSIGSAAVNVTLEVEPSADRWTPVLRGPRWGPVPLIWANILVMLALAYGLGQITYVPLATWQWALLGLGLSQVHPLETAIIAGTLLAFGYRAARPPSAWWRFNALQMALLGGAGAAALCLYHAVYSGLVSPPDMLIEGNGSTRYALSWFTDHSAGDLPVASMLALPTWTWRVGMLLWALWLALTLVRLAPWGWRAMSVEGLWRMPHRGGPETAAEVPATATPNGDRADADAPSEAPDPG